MNNSVGRMLLRSLGTGIVCLLALITSAQVTWRRTYGGYGTDRAYSVRQTSDGGYIIAGSTGSFGSGGGDVYLVRVDEFGEPLWTRTYGDIGVDVGIACRELSDGYVIAGSTSTGTNGGYDMLLIRTDETGVPIWERQFGTPDWDLCNTMEVLADGFVLGGISYGAGTPIGAAYVVRTDLNGDTIWTTTTGGAFRTECSGIAATSDMGLIIAGVMGTISGFDDGFLTKLDEAGNEEWTTPLGGDSADYLVSVLVTPGGDLVASGGTHSLNPYMQIYVVSLNAGGGVNWERDLGSVADAAATEIRMDHAGGFVFTGYNTLNAGNRDMILTVTDANGWFQFGYNFGDGEPADGYSIDPTDDGGYVVAGWAENYGPGVRSMYVVKTDSIGHTASLSVDAFLDPLDVNDIPPQWYALNLFPNPATGHALITLTGLEPSASFDLEILDATGRIMLSTDLPAGERTIALKGLSPGMYLVELRSRGVRVASVRLCIE